MKLFGVSVRMGMPGGLLILYCDGIFLLQLLILYYEFCAFYLFKWLFL